MSSLRLASLGALASFLLVTVACTSPTDERGASESDIKAMGLPGEPVGGLPPPPPRCGGIGGLSCPSGFDCKLEGAFPDAMGTCEKAPVWDVCNVDSDCVAVPVHSCCSFNEKEAVNKDHIADYNAGFNPFVCACAPPSGEQLLHVRPNGTPLCIANRCEMVQPKNIVCGGHSPNPHKCPEEFACMGAGLPVDAPGNCVKIEDIVCGGHSPHPQSCPDGYSCQGAGLPVDAPGKCVKDVKDT